MSLFLLGKRLRRAASCVSIALLAASSPALGVEAEAAHELLRKRCVRCHGPRTQESGLRLDSLRSVLRGGASGVPALVAGDPGGSLLIQRVSSATDALPQMPPIGSPLSSEEVGQLAAWIEAGAEFPADPQLTGQVHWAYQAPVRPALPRGPGGAIDRFVRERLGQEGLEPSPRAGEDTLLRRVYLDLIGLPPSPAEVRRFRQLPNETAYEQTVNELLAWPAFGEKWAQYWLDLARYADSNGFEKDGPRETWRWRDWVIDALNRDMPFDRFATLQIAGDLLAGAQSEHRVATGFLRNSMINEEGGIDPEEYHVEAVADRVETVGTVFLATTFGCARCHDHKFDPISQEEYTGLFAFFNDQQSDFRRVNSFTHLAGGPRVYFPSPDQEPRLEAARAAWTAVQSTLGEEAEERAAARAALMRAMLDLPRKVDSSLVMRELAEPRTTRMHEGGNFRTPGKVVPPTVPAIFPGPPPRPMRGEGERADRLDFARWMVSSENPLFARVAVNRIWEQLFGRGLVLTTEDFGSQGDLPSHPELLDWLALEFRWQGLSLKSLIRELVISETYRRSAHATAEQLERDPDNVLLARGPRFRMSAEMLRDQALAASGLLVTRVGGPSVFPYQPPGVWNMPYSSQKWTTSDGEDRYRRGLYTWWQRSAPYPAFVNFDAPSRERSCSRRARTNTPLQALTTLNDPTFFEAARALAERVLDVPGSDRERLRMAFELVLVRSPTSEENARLEQLLGSLRQRMEDDPAAAQAVAPPALSADGPSPATSITETATSELGAWTLVSNVLLNLDETLTKE